MNTVELSKVSCKRCGHKWVARIKRPVQCPKCKSPYWDSEPRKLKIKEEKNGKQKIQ